MNQARQAPLIKPSFLEIERPESDGARTIYDYWLSKKPDAERIPPRSAIAFDELVELRCADRVFICEPAPDGSETEPHTYADWKYRLIGSEIVRMFGREVTNIPFRDHMTPDEADFAIMVSNRVARTRRPIFLKARFVSGEYSGFIETMSLPICGRDEKSVWLFGGTFFERT